MLSEPEQNYGLGMDALVSVTLLEDEQTSWPSQYFVKVVSYRNARYTVRASESRLPDENKFSAFCRNAEVLTAPALRALPSPRKCVKYCGGQ